MRILSSLLLLGGLLIMVVASVDAYPGVPGRDAGSAGRACGLVDDAQAGATCERRVRLSAQISGTELLLNWQGSRARVFDLYYSSTPYLGYVQVDQARGQSYRELLAHISLAEINDYYQVRETGTGKVSNRLGVFTFPLAGAA